MKYIFQSLNELAAYFEAKATDLRNGLTENTKKNERKAIINEASAFEYAGQVLRNTEIRAK